MGDFIAAGQRQTYVQGIRIPSKKDIRYAHLMDVKMILETAKAHKIQADELVDKSVIDEIKHLENKEDSILDEVELD
tara:strand:+ start:160 stop:390 length:231 start_codon:yes stop_codon:yes gene_type:complete